METFVISRNGFVSSEKACSWTSRFIEASASLIDKHLQPGPAVAVLDMNALTLEQLTKSRGRRRQAPNCCSLTWDTKVKIFLYILSATNLEKKGEKKTFVISSMFLSALIRHMHPNSPPCAHKQLTYMISCWKCGQIHGIWNSMPKYAWAKMRPEIMT